jgi:hypothetical protein
MKINVKIANGLNDSMKRIICFVLYENLSRDLNAESYPLRVQIPKLFQLTAQSIDFSLHYTLHLQDVTVFVL